MAEGDNQFRVVPEEPGQDDQPPEMLRAEPAANQGAARAAAGTPVDPRLGTGSRRSSQVTGFGGGDRSGKRDTPNYR